jgi:hypothetical protein
MAYKTKYQPKNKQKYVGDSDNIVCRSLWERHVCKFCDENPNIVKWSSEEIIIPYFNPLKNKITNYIPDFLIQIKINNILETWLIEVKPKKQTILKENASKKEKLIWAINNSKWKAAEVFCKKNNFKFKILTERELFSNAT